MYSLRALGLLGFALFAGPVFAQTAPAPKAPLKARHPVHASRNPNGGNSRKTQGSYAAPGEPITVQDNGKNTPPYDGPAAGHGAKPKGTTLPK